MIKLENRGSYNRIRINGLHFERYTYVILCVVGLRCSRYIAGFDRDQDHPFNSIYRNCILLRRHVKQECGIFRVGITNRYIKHYINLRTHLPQVLRNILSYAHLYDRIAYYKIFYLFQFSQPSAGRLDF